MNGFIVRLLLLFLAMSMASNAFSDSRYFDSEGVKIHYKDYGKGSVVILLHGYTMDNKMWENSLLLKTLVKKHRVITPDFRGHGLSDKPLNAEKNGPELGMDIIRLLEHLNIPKAHFVGFSMGANVVGRLLVTHPERMLSATLGSGYFPFWDKHEQAYAEETANHLLKTAGKSKDEEKKKFLALAAVAQGWKYDAVTDQQISSIKVPFQAVFGSLEQNALFQSQKYRFTLSQSARPMVVIEGADHDSQHAAVLTSEFTQSVVMLVENIDNNG